MRTRSAPRPQHLPRLGDTARGLQSHPDSQGGGRTGTGELQEPRPHHRLLCRRGSGLPWGRGSETLPPVRVRVTMSLVTQCPDVLMGPGTTGPRTVASVRDVPQEPEAGAGRQLRGLGAPCSSVSSGGRPTSTLPSPLGRGWPRSPSVTASGTAVRGDHRSSRDRHGLTPEQEARGPRLPVLLPGEQGGSTPGRTSQSPASGTLPLQDPPLSREKN